MEENLDLKDEIIQVPIVLNNVSGIESTINNINVQIKNLKIYKRINEEIGEGLLEIRKQWYNKKKKKSKSITKLKNSIILDLLIIKYRVEKNIEKDIELIDRDISELEKIIKELELEKKGLEKKRRAQFSNYILLTRERKREIINKLTQIVQKVKEIFCEENIEDIKNEIDRMIKDKSIYENSPENLVSKFFKYSRRKFWLFFNEDKPSNELVQLVDICWKEDQQCIEKRFELFKMIKKNNDKKDENLIELFELSVFEKSLEEDSLEVEVENKTNLEELIIKKII